MANELNEIAGSINEFGQMANQFKQASAEHDNNISSIIKDVHSVISTQKRDINELGNNLEDIVSQSQQQTARRIDSTNSLLQQSVFTQNMMLNVLKNIDRNIKNMGAGGGGGMLGNIGSGLLGGAAGMGGGGLIKNLAKSSFLRKMGFAGAAGFLGYEAGTAAYESFKNTWGDSTSKKEENGITNDDASRVTSSGASNSTGGGNNPQSASSVKPSDQNGSSAQAMSFFQQQGWTKEQAAGIVGNLQVESGNFSSDVISGKRRGDNGQAVGIAQWHPDRQALFRAYKGHDLSNSTFQEQLEFVQWELMTKYTSAHNALKQSRTAEEAADAFNKHYEISKNRNNPNASDNKQRRSNAISLAGSTGKPQSNAAAVPKVDQNEPSIAPPATPAISSPNVSAATPQAPSNASPNVQQAVQTRADPAIGVQEPSGGNGRLPDSMLVSIGGNNKLQPAAADAYKQMVDAARKDGVSWSVTDSYRTYDEQVKLAKQKGLYSQGGLAARPGTSKHGWGTALDLGGGANSRGSKQNEWLQQNAARFGFGTIAREPWHWQYNGGGVQKTGGSGATESAGNSFSRTPIPSIGQMGSGAGANPLSAIGGMAGGFGGAGIGKLIGNVLGNLFGASQQFGEPSGMMSSGLLNQQGVETAALKRQKMLYRPSESKNPPVQQIINNPKPDAASRNVQEDHNVYAGWYEKLKSKYEMQT